MHTHLRLIFNTAQLGFYHCTLKLNHCKNVQCYPPTLGPGHIKDSVIALHDIGHKPSYVNCLAYI